MKEKKQITISLRSRHVISFFVLIVGIVIFSYLNIVNAVTPNPGHPWTEVGDGTFIVTGPTVARTYTFPDANATVLTSNNAVTVAQGGTGTTTFQANGVVFSDGTKLTQDVAGLNFDTTNDRLGIATSSSFAKLSVKSSGTTSGIGFQVTNSADHPLFSIYDDGTMLLGSSGPPYGVVEGSIEFGSSNYLVGGFSAVPTWGDSAGFGSQNQNTMFGLSNAFSNVFIRSGGNQMAVFNDDGVSIGKGVTEDDSLATLHVKDFTASTGSTKLYLQAGAGQSTNELLSVYANDGTTPYLNVRSGKVGIGTTTPFAQLGLNAPAGVPSFMVGSSTATSFIIDKSGSVGINTVTPQTAGSKLFISAGAADVNAVEIYAPSISSKESFLMWVPLTTTLSNGKAFTVQVPGETSARGVFYSDGSYGIGPGNATRDVMFSRLAASTLMISSNRTTSGLADLVVTGNIGIGTTTAGSALSIGNTGNNTINISSTATSTLGTGMNIRGGCYAVNGTCISSGSSGSSGTDLTAVTEPRFAATGAVAATALSSLTVYNVGLFSIIGNITVNQLTYNVGAVTTAGTYRICVYTDDGGTKVIDVTDVPTAGVNTVTVTPAATLTQGKYYIVMGCATTCNNTISMFTTTAVAWVNGASVPAGKRVYEGTATMTSGTCNTTMPTITGSNSKMPVIRFDN